MRIELHEFNCVTQKILTENIINWQELITEILNFHHTFSVRKTTTQLFQYFRISTKNHISGIFWVFKSKLQINHLATYIALFLPDSNNCFFICLVPYIHICLYYFLILCFYFHRFDTLLTTRHFTIYNFWFYFITSESELESNLELNNPELTLILLRTLRC